MFCQVLAIAIVTLAAGAGDALFTQPRARIIAANSQPRPTVLFSVADESLLDEVQHAAFNYFWNEVGSEAKLAKDRLHAPVASIASVGFQLAALPIGVQRGWISADQGRRRALTVLRSLIERRDNKYRGMYLHFPDHNTAGPSDSGYEGVASTVDTALLIAGAIPAGTYFGGDVSDLVDRLIREADWKAYARPPDGFLSMGWRPRNLHDMDAGGAFLNWDWHDASDEERLIYFLAVGTPVREHAVAPRTYYKLHRVVKGYDDLPPFVVSYPGALFTYFFSQLFIDYRAFGPDDPEVFGVDQVRVDWFENARRAVLTHRRRCIEQAGRFKTFATDRWGLSACVGRDGYIVPQVRPNLSEQDQWHDGTVAPYAAAAAIMFAPVESLRAIRAFRGLTDAASQPVVWRDPATGGYGFVDAFNLDQSYASDDYVGIDQGPILLAIENARTGLIWRLFMRHAASRRAVQRLKWTPLPRATPTDTVPAGDPEP